MLHKPFRSPFDASFVELPSVDSTNNYALHEVRQGKAGHGAAFFTWQQTSGKGQMGRKWQSEKGDGIALSVVLQPVSMTVAAQFHLIACVATAALDFLRQYAGNEMRIKWPNDLYWQDRKLGGILIESVIGSGENSWKWAVAGVGINLNQSAFPDDLPNPVSMKQITGRGYHAVDLARDLHVHILDHYEKLKTEGFTAFFSAYNNSLYKRNEKVRLKQGAKVFETIITGVTDEGRLVTQINGIEELYTFGELQWIV